MVFDRKAHYDKKKALGLCSQCSHPKIEGSCFCLECLEKNGVSQKKVLKRNKDRKKDGLCRDCGEICGPTEIRCYECHLKHKETRKKLRSKRFQNGICQSCPEKIHNGTVFCEKHSIISNQRSIEHAKIRKDKGICLRCSNQAAEGKYLCQDHLDRMKNERKILLSKGICGHCKKEKILDNGTLCSTCKTKRKEHRNKKIESGICVSYGCYNKSVDGLINCRECKEKARKRKAKYKQIVLDHYGQKCNCKCGCTVVKINHLTVDHINNDGKEHRRRRKKDGGTFSYKWIIDHNFPDDLQILCWNCNCAKQFYGGCG